MAPVNSFTLIDINGNESSKRIPTGGITVGDLVADNQQALVDDTVMGNGTTIRSGDTVEIIAKSGKAGLAA